MPRTFKKSRLHPNEHKPKNKQEVNNSKLFLPPNLKSLKKTFITIRFLSIQLSLEDFQFLDNEPFDDSIIKKDFLKVYHKQGAQLN